MNKKSIIFLACLGLLASGCINKNKDNKIENNNEVVQESKLDENKNRPYLISNMNDKNSLDLVKSTIEKNLSGKNAETFVDLVRDYNKSIPNDLLSGDFESPSKEDKTGEIIEIRSSISHKYPDTNCRINSFLLLKDEIKFNSNSKIDDDLLFMDEDAIKNSNLFTDDEFINFKKLFSRVSTNNGKDPKIQGEKMSKFLSNFTFPEKTYMISVVLHDNLDEDYLFIGHVGVLIPLREGFLFLEKISFEEPYQAIKFPDKESCYKYLKEKFQDYKDPNVAPPFIMENNKYIGM